MDCTTKEYSSLIFNKEPDIMTPEQSYELKEKVATLQSQLLTAHPQMPILLRTIHTQLAQDPELVTVLTEEEIGIIVRGLGIQMKTEITTTPVKKESASAIINKALKAGKGKSVADLF